MILLFLKLLISPTKFCKSSCVIKLHEVFTFALVWNVCAQLYLISFIQLLISTFLGLKPLSDFNKEASNLDNAAIIAPYLCILEFGIFMLYVFYYTGLKNADIAH